MKKKIIGKIAALSLAGLTVLPTMSIVSSADVTANSSGGVDGKMYVVTVPYTDPVSNVTQNAYHYYINLSSIPAEYSGYEKATVDITTQFPYGTTVYIKSGEITGTAPSGSYKSYVVRSEANQNDATPPSKGRFATNTSYCGNVTGKWYPSMTALLNDGNTRASTTRDLTTAGLGWTETNRYFSVSNGYYFPYSIDGDTYEVYGRGTDTETGIAGTVPAGYRYSDSVSYYSYEKQQYYPNLAALQAAVGYSTTNYSIHTLKRSYSATYCYFDTTDGEYKSTSAAGRVIVNNGYNNYYGYWYSTYTNQYYTTYEAALKASQNASQVIPVDYYNGYYYGYNYNDPYYWFYYYLNNNDSSSSSSSTGTISITGTSSWTTLANRIKSTAAGKTISVEMNDQTIIPSSIFTALKGKDVTVSLRLDNGVVYTINGKNVTSAKDVNVITTYNTNRIPTSLVKKAYQKYNAVSTAQISINSNSFGAKAGVTVKFATKRAGCTARLYRYNPDKRTLSLVDTSTVASTGKCTFEGVAKGGDFVVILS